ncbi:MAG: transporter [Cyclobacteriaceae bacterium]
MRNILFLSLIFIFPLFTSGQTSETIVSSRPGQACAPNVTGTGVFQVQSGFTIGGSETGTNDLINDNIFVHNTLLRFGLSEKFEVRASVTAQEVRTSGQTINSTDVSGINDISVGMRYVLLDGNSTAGKLSVQTDFGLPLRTGGYQANEDLSYQLLVIQTYPIFTENLSLNINLGIFSSGFSESPDGKYVINLSHPIGTKTSVFIENYGFITDGSLETLFDGGFAYLLNNDLQLDFSAGYGRTTSDGVQTTQWFTDAGVSFRFN